MFMLLYPHSNYLETPWSLKSENVSSLLMVEVNRRSFALRVRKAKHIERMVKDESGI